MFSLSKIFKYIWPHARKYKISIFLVILGYVSGAILDNLIKPYLYKEVIDTLSSSQPKDVILQGATEIAIWIAVIIVIYNIAYRIGDYAISLFESRMIKDLHDYTFKHLIAHSYGFFANNFTGGLVAKAKRFTRAFEVFTDVLSFQILFSVVNLLGVLVVLFWQVPHLGYVFLFWSMLYLYITFLFLKKKLTLDLIEAEADSKVTGSFADAITNVLNIKIFVRSLAEISKFENVTLDEETKRRKTWYFANLQNAAQAALMAMLQIVFLFVSIRLWSMDRLSVGTIVMLQTYMFNVFNILWHLGKSLTRQIKALADMTEMVSIFETKVDILDPVKPEVLNIKNGEIVFNNVSFGYTSGEEVLNGFNLKIKSGEKVGVVGHSGAGKSTITKLLLRFNDINSGELFIDGQDVRRITQDDLRKMISYVPQESILFHRSIRDNIAYGKEGATENEIIRAAKRAHAHEFIEKLSSGYDTFVGERGVKLSGGERQRVAIARAMLKDAPILVLDEATSSLDSVSESYIQDAFDELMRGKTTIVIAHRLSTIQKMDRIIVLDKGRIVEEGTHKELLEKRGVYAELWEHQTGGFLEE